MNNKEKGITQKFFDWVFNKKDIATQKPYRIKGFDAAKIDRLTSNWNTSLNSLDKDIYSSSATLRSRARDLSLNNDYVKKYLNLMTNNIVGPNGFNLQIQAKDYNGNIDTSANSLIENYFFEWSKKTNCEVSGKYSFNDLCRLIIKTVSRDGECIIRKIRTRTVNKFGFALQILDIDRLDQNYNQELKNGNVIKMGVELNPYGKPVAYHIKKYKNQSVNSNEAFDVNNYERIVADDLIHLFITERAEQTRGYTWLHTTMISLKHLESYQEAALVNARVGASKMGFFTSTNPSNDATQIADTEDDQGNLIMEADPGVFSVLPDGYDFKSFNPDYPSGEYQIFIKSVLRSIASGLNISYNSLASDLEGVNYSSIRAGLLEERDMYMNIQNWFITNFLEDIYIDWLNTSMLNNAITFYNGTKLPIEKFDKFAQHAWKGRRWSWVDPLKDVNASVVAINNNLKSRTDIISENGLDIEDVFIQISKERELAKKYGINLPEEIKQDTALAELSALDNEQ